MPEGCWATACLNAANSSSGEKVAGPTKSTFTPVFLPMSVSPAAASCQYGKLRLPQPAHNVRPIGGMALTSAVRNRKCNATGYAQNAIQFHVGLLVCRLPAEVIPWEETSYLRQETSTTTMSLAYAATR